MAQQTIGIGSAANDGTGDTARVAFDKVNDNFGELYAVAIPGGLAGLATDSADPANSDNIVWTHANDLNRGPVIVGAYEGGINDERSVMNVSRVSPITGVLIEYLDSGCPLGAGTLTYASSGTTLQWTANGDSAGVATNVGAGGFFGIPSGTASRKMYVFVTAADLPVSNTSETVDVVATKPADGLFFIGHNGFTSGNLVNDYDRFCTGYVIEQAFHDGSAMVSEFYTRIRDGYTGVEQRPWFLKWDRDNSRIKEHKVIGPNATASSIGYVIGIDDGTQQGVSLWNFKQYGFEYLADWAVADDVRNKFESYSAKKQQWVYSCNADDVASTNGTMMMSLEKLGASSQHRMCSFTMRSNGSTTHKTGAFVLRGDDTSGVSAVLLGVGGTNGGNALIEVTHANMPTTYPTLQITGKASQTRGVIEYIHPTGSERRWNLHTDGYIFVRESGNTTTNRTPGTGTTTVTMTDSGGDTITWSNKPGSNNRTTPTTWIPVLDTSGALHWIPAWQD